MTGALGDSEACLVEVSAALAARQGGPLAAALRGAAQAGADPTAVEEALLQAYLFLGYPAALNAFRLWRELSGREAPAQQEEDWDGWRRRGEQVCRRVYGNQYESLAENVRGLHADLGSWMIVEGYGKVLGRPGLELRVRELCIVALLAVLDAPRQLHSHLRGCLNTGASPAQVEDVLERALRHATPDAQSRARETWQTVRARWKAPARAEQAR
jgi:4-carboxymuconolactone decarboxylase